MHASSSASAPNAFGEEQRRTKGLGPLSTSEALADPLPASSSSSSSVTAVEDYSSVMEDIYATPDVVATAASIASILTKSVLHPIDTLKCRVQLLPPVPRAAYSHGRGGSSLRQRCSYVSAWYRTLYRQYTGQWGVRHLFGGLPVKLVLYVPYQTAYLSGYNMAQRAMINPVDDAAGHGSHRDGHYLRHTIAAAIAAEAASCTIRVPMEAMKMRVQSTAVTGSLQAVQQLRRNGWLACVRLAIPQTLMHDIPYSIIQWVVYETLRPWTNEWSTIEEQKQHGSKTDNSGGGSSTGSDFWSRYGVELLRTFLSGGCSGCIASTLTVPLDNIRTRVVVATAGCPDLTVRQVVAAAYRREGLRGFTRGGAMRVLWVTSNMACYFPLFEGVKAAMQRRVASKGSA